MQKRQLTYRDAGVDIDKADELVGRIKSVVEKTFTKNVLSGIGGFGAAYQLPQGYKEPVLVSGTDGVGTKLKVAQAAGKHFGVGIDLVAMCVNDILTLGAKPLFFLDYLATGRLIPKVAEEVISGIAKGCELAQCSLIGGETAEMPDFYPPGEYDLAGFAVGIVEKGHIVDGSAVKEGDVVIGLKSSGFHSNGFSLLRKIFFELLSLSVDDYVPELKKRVWEILLEPTKIYVKPVLSLLSHIRPKAMAHITGGGIPGNLSRVIPDGLCAQIEINWQIPSIFEFVQRKGNVPLKEMFRTFNMGIGFILVVSPDDLSETFKILERANEEPFVIGKILKGDKKVVIKGIE